MKTNFYDIESLDNVFTLCNFQPEDGILEVYYLCDDASLTNSPDFKKNVTQCIRKNNRNLDASTANNECDIRLFDLHETAANERLAMTFGLSDSIKVTDKRYNTNSQYPEKYRLVCTTDDDYDDNKHPFLFGYNSFNYDTTMLSLYLYDTFRRGTNIPNSTTSSARQSLMYTIMPPSAQKMRKYNDTLFTVQFNKNMPSFLQYEWTDNNGYIFDGYDTDKAIIRRNMLMSGRHLDVARLNEKQQHVGLKRLLGMLGYQILESDKLHGNQTSVATPEQLYDLLAYNASDVINLYWLFKHPLYQGQFSLKRGLLNSYPELIYQEIRDEYKPNIDPAFVRKDRLTIDSSSAKFATLTLCPYQNLDDMEVVSYMYPTDEKAKELGITPVDVLEEAKDFFYRHFPQQELRDQFNKIYNYYASIRGKNFNESKNYQRKYTGGTINATSIVPLNQMPKDDCCIPYFDKDGNPTSCFVTFSTGGIHGAEYNLPLYQYDLRIYQQAKARLDEVKALYPAPEDLKKAKKVTLSDGIEYPAGQFLKSGSTQKNASWKNLKVPVLFKRNDKDNSTKLNDKYVFTSAGRSNHEDFISYYPNLLRQMEAFYNKGLGEDRYAKIFFQKQDYGKKMKDESLPSADRNLFSVLREGTKLILNSASGAGDTNFESNIRMNNRIISMRIIGQLFSWRIGQAQAIGGASIISTNTDGLYSVLEEKLNNQILERESKDIGVEIEPELTFLVSKDSNNRLEYDLTRGKITSASGGTLGCWKGPNPTKALSHPAILDWALANYLVKAAQNIDNTSLDKPLNEDVGRKILESSFTEFSDSQWLKMYQNVIASSIGTVSYIFGTNPDTSSINIMQHYNRVFIMKDKTPGTCHLHAAVARKITPAIQKQRQRNHLPPVSIDPTANQVLNANGVKCAPPGTDVIVKKVTNIESEWYMLICNEDLYNMPHEQVQFIKNNIDLDKYLALLKKSFEQNWMNVVPE